MGTTRIALGTRLQAGLSFIQDGGFRNKGIFPFHIETTENNQKLFFCPCLADWAGWKAKVPSTLLKREVSWGFRSV